MNNNFRKFIARNQNYCYLLLGMLILNIIVLVINSVAGLITLLSLIIFNIIFIKKGGLKLMKKKKVNTIENKTKKVSNKKKRKKILKILINAFLLLLLIVLIGGIIFAIYIVSHAPEFKPENLYSSESSIVYDKDGNQVGKLGVEKRKNVKYDELPQILVDAIIATEDSRYMLHNGFDLPRFLKASLGQVVNKLKGSGNAGGGSTLDMQVVKNRYTSTVSSGFDGIVRKFTDIYISIFKLEKNYSKEEILEFYVNIPFMGNQSYGVEQACQSYFGKSVSDINLSEAALIAGLFQAPTSYDPYRHPDLAAERRETVLYLMRRHGYITEEEEKIANSIPVKSLLRESNPESDSNQYQPYLNIVIDEIEDKTGLNPYTTGMRIYTNLDTSKQRLLNDIMSGKTWTWKDDKVQAGIAVVDVNSGALVAVGGGRNQNGERVLNYAADISRHIGSCAKPLFDYGPAFEYNNASLASQVYDGPHSYSSGVSVKNADGSYGGVMTYKYALAASRNVPALKVFQSNNNAKVLEFVTKLGIKPEIDSAGGLHEAHALGAFNGSNPVQMAGAYAAFANGGYYTKPYTVNKIEYIDSDKTVSLKNKKEKVMSDSTAYMITDALTYAVEGYRNIYGTVSGVKLAAKTGTSTFSSEARRLYGYPSSANMDMWVTGYTPEYAVSLWYGYTEAEKGYYIGSEGYTTRGRLFRQVIAGISDRSGTKKFTVPNSVVKVTVEKETAPLALPSANTPDNMKVTEYFKRGTQPTEVSPRYNTLPNASGLNAKENGNNIELTWNAAAKPEYLTDDYLRKYMKTLYGSKTEEQLAVRKASDGEYGYEVLVKDNNTGTTTSLGFTTNTSFKTTKQNKNVTYIIKTCYSNLRITQSNGISIEVKASSNTSTNNNLLTYKLNGNIDDKAVVNKTYTDPGIIVYNEGIDITDKATITVTCTELGTNKKQKDTYTFTKAGKYTLKYTIKYNNSVETTTRAITVTDDTTTTPTNPTTPTTPDNNQNN
ncbi:MAG: transglycosylase domain-containing protein [Bacilli bacterium]|nr:transglycosylase domain-containing protein [Bacilli bacterium]